jgi:NADPH2:quinone reductase
MRAIRQHAFGGPEELRLEQIADLHPSEGQVRIRVESAGVHLIDTAIRRGRPGGPYPLPDLPMTPGREVAGRIDETGQDVDKLLTGHAVAMKHVIPRFAGSVALGCEATTAIRRTIGEPMVSDCTEITQLANAIFDKMDTKDWDAAERLATGTARLQVELPHGRSPPCCSQR